MNKYIPPALRNLIFIARKAYILLTKRRYDDGLLMRGATATRSQLGEKSVIHKHSTINNCKILRFTYVSANSSITNCNIGSFCSVGPQCKIGLARHPSKVFCSTYPAFFSYANAGARSSFVSETVFNETPPPTIIGHDVWIGSDVIIPGGINVNNGSIVAAGAVVVKDVPEYAIVGGNPAKIIGWRFDLREREQLSHLEWWRWSESTLKSASEFGAFSSVGMLSKFSESISETGE